MLSVCAPSPPVPAVSTRSARVGSTGEDVLAHRLGAAGDLVHGLALQPKRDEEAADLRRRRLAAHDLAHRLARLGPGQVPSVEEAPQCVLDHALTVAPRARGEDRRHSSRQQIPSRVTSSPLTATR